MLSLIKNLHALLEWYLINGHIFPEFVESCYLLFLLGIGAAVSGGTCIFGDLHLPKVFSLPVTSLARVLGPLAIVCALC